jgi:hypothetical protein
MANVDPIDLQGLKTYSIARRRNLVKLRDFGTLADGRKAADFINSLPSIYAARDLRALINDIVRAHKKKKTVACAMGGHVIKVGCGPVIADLVERGVVTAIAMNGAAAIHDYELSLIGETSEDVAETLQNGSFGMARETAEAFAQAALLGSSGAGLGHAIAEKALRNKHRKISPSPPAPSAGCRHGPPLGRRRHHPHAPAGLGPRPGRKHADRLPDPVEHRRRARRRRLDEPRLRGDDARGVPQGRVGRAQPGPQADELHHGQPRHDPALPAEDERPRPPEGEGIAITGHHEILLPLVRAGVVAALEGRAIRP